MSPSGGSAPTTPASNSADSWRRGRPAIGAGDPWRRPVRTRDLRLSRLMATPGRPALSRLIIERTGWRRNVPFRRCWACRSIDIAQPAGDLSWCGGAGDEGGDDEVACRSRDWRCVVSHRRPGVGVRRRLLASRNGTRRPTPRDERGTQAVRRDLLADPGPPGQPLGAFSGGAVHPSPAEGAEDRTTARSPRYSSARGGRGARGTLTCLPPFRVELVAVQAEGARLRGRPSGGARSPMGRGR